MAYRDIKTLDPSNGRTLKEDNTAVNMADMIEALYNALVVNKNAGVALTGSSISKNNALPAQRIPQYELNTLADAVSVLAGDTSEQYSLGLDGTETEVYIVVNIDKQPWTLYTNSLFGGNSYANYCYPSFSDNVNVFAASTRPAIAFLMGISGGSVSNGLAEPSSMLEAKMQSIPYGTSLKVSVKNNHATDMATATIKVLRVWR